MIKRKWNHLIRLILQVYSFTQYCKIPSGTNETTTPTEEAPASNDDEYGIVFCDLDTVRSSFFLHESQLFT